MEWRKTTRYTPLEEVFAKHKRRQLQAEGADEVETGKPGRVPCPVVRTNLDGSNPVVYGSARAAAIALGRRCVYASAIYMVLCGAKSKVYGYKWEYLK
jgi:hypothetical protein